MIRKQRKLTQAHKARLKRVYLSPMRYLQEGATVEVEVDPRLTAVEAARAANCDRVIRKE